MKYRNRPEIISNILYAANGGASKTKIMYKAFLSYAQIKEYLPTLLEKNLLELEEDGKYRTTERGIQFLKMNEEIQELIESKSLP
ncbi:MAG TPA: winged helix-turn-helix domain-containing protein [Candidatus Nitrosocosmicus sp.]|nr:winged helix-turn-helix domain-containing protein [Candidatus Nitrosocosmicus sp.]